MPVLLVDRVLVAGAHSRTIMAGDNESGGEMDSTCIQLMLSSHAVQVMTTVPISHGRDLHDAAFDLNCTSLLANMESNTKTRVPKVFV